jgi:intracellular sulfur oxidation DsrE/DsrF family protein
MSVNKTNRRGFLSTIFGGAAAIGLAPIVGNSEAKAENIKPLKYHPAERIFWDLKGKHKMVFDTCAIKGGAALGWAFVFLKTNNETGTEDKDLNVVFVMRSAALSMIFNDAMWEKYKLGEICKFDDPETKLPAVRNFFIIPDKDDPGMTIQELQKRGVVLCACQVALEGTSERIAEKMTLDKEVVRQDLLANLLPNVKVVPSGVWALGRAQEKGCAYVASV